MATDKPNPIEELNESEDGLTRPALGPSDSSDLANDLPPRMPDADSDRQNTGERAEVENAPDPTATDIEADEIVPAERAGLARSEPDPERNGG